ncbi:DUF2577 domain-containing protein [Paenibacillus yanchengensis]|uniref:DUF2577 domain-containing protein n=1 Tax=Paenibacillus yanchengensis TaxID=2035833 RepID=A0ABW4YNK2_9BACL
MTNLLSTIKQAAMDAVDASNPVSIVYGEVVQVEPLEIKVDQRFVLSAGFLIVPESLKKLELKLAHTHEYSDTGINGETKKTTEAAKYEEPIVIRTGLLARDKVIMLRLQGGQKYLLLDRVVKT